MIEFDDCANYRGSLQVKEENGIFFWRVDCDLGELPWLEIPTYLGKALFDYYATNYEGSEETGE